MAGGYDEGMEQNPYEAPREAGRYPRFNWRRLCLAGAWTAASFIAVAAFVSTFTFFPRERPVLAVVTSSLMLLSLVGIVGGGIAAIVGGIGWASTASSNRD